MNESYHYLTIQTSRGELNRLRSALRQDAGGVLGSFEGAVVGVWLGAGSIGWADDEAIVLIGPTDRGTGSEWTGPLHIEGTCVAVPLQATVRPVDPGPMRSTGVHAHRWLDVEPGNIDEAIDLSAQAWPAFEASFDARIEGLFRTTDGSSRLLLVTWYSSVAEWERSRGVPGTEHGALDEARRMFQRRRQLTRRQIVRLAPPMP